MYSVGIPDILVAKGSRMALIEVKFSKKDVVRSRKIGLRPAQVAWLTRLGNASSSGYILDKAGGTYRLFRADRAVRLSDSLSLQELNSEAMVITTDTYALPVLAAVLGGEDV
jgi:Holliday junction resolvase